jgi:hypothetical protein
MIANGIVARPADRDSEACIACQHGNPAIRLVHQRSAIAFAE